VSPFSPQDWHRIEGTLRAGAAEIRRANPGDDTSGDAAGGLERAARRGVARGLQHDALS
jgi:hypothetical protein